MLAIYRKYRPKLLEDLLGQEDIVTVLKNAVIKNKLAHAYLFSGPRGTGKTTAARLIAKIANCSTREKKEDFRKKGEPCNKCERCSAIDEGRALDVVEIDAASNRGIDEIRNLQESARSSPSSYPYKVFIIDESHMLTTPAFNALLKLLEEPPEHAIFILATTEYEKIPPTISSRSQKFSFKKLAIDEIIKKLKKVVLSEKFKIDDDAIELIASTAEGSLRDAESLLDQITSLAEQVTVGAVEKIVGRTGFVLTHQLADLVLKSKLPESLEMLAKIYEKGYNLADLNKEFIHYLRRVLSLKLDSRLEDVFKKELTKKELEQLKTHVQLIDVPKHIQLIRSLIRAYSEMRYSPFVIVPLEIALIENLSS
ncbi:MAG: DNA polymerase III subunit gamma/tau [bacterium]|nr:DNA polymerase III subunit gamma/tau [bacterium]